MTPNRRRALVTIGAGAAAAGIGVFAGARFLGREASTNKRLLSATFPDLDGRQRALAEWKGKILVVNFWATWCAPCLEEIPMLVAARQMYMGKGLEVVGIGIDLAAKISEMARKLSITYPVLIAGPDALDLMRDAGNKRGGLPYTVFLDRNAVFAKDKTGALTRGELDHILGQLLKG